MKTGAKSLLVIFVISSILLNACGNMVATPAPQANQPAAVKVKAVETAFTGVIESMNGGQWVIDGQTLTVDPSVVHDGPFNVGDTVKVEGTVQADGTVLITRVENPNVASLLALGNEMPVTGNVPAMLVFDDNGEEASGTVDAISATSVIVNGQSFDFAPGAEVKGQISSGSFVKLHFVVNPDGMLAVREIELTTPGQIAEDNANSNADNSNSLNANDGDSSTDDRNNINGSDDNSNNSKDDKGGNSGKGGGGNDNGNDDN